jgi:hypothetical protein
MPTEKVNHTLPLNVYEKRFLLLMKLVRIDQMLKNAKITHQPMK